MNERERDKSLRAVKIIADDMESDARALDEKPFDAKNVGEAFGNVMAAVFSLTKVVELLLQEEKV